MKIDKNIVVVVSGDVVGGHEMQLSNVLHGLSTSFKSVTVICSSSETYGYFRRLDCVVHLVDFGVKGKIWTQWKAGRNIAAKLKPYLANAAGLLVSGGTIEACIGVARGAKLLSPAMPVAAYIPMYIDRSLSHGLIGAVYNVLANRMARTIDKFLTINRIQARIIKKKFKRPVEYVENQVREVAAPLVSHGRRLIFVGRFDDDQKGVGELIRYLDSESNPYKELVLIGDGPDKGLVVAAAEAASSIKVSILGWRSSAEIDALLGLGDCLVMNSRWEGEPLVIREFTARGLPCITRNIVGVRGVTLKSLRFTTQQELLTILSRLHACSIGAMPVKRPRPPKDDQRAVLEALF